MASDISEALRAEVARRAGGRCEYCLIHELEAGFQHQVDHIVSRKHGGQSTSDNLAYACVICNRYKDTDIAAIDQGSGKIARLFDPRPDAWSDHFQLEGATIKPISSVGSATVSLLRLNTPERISERQLLQSLRRYPQK